jgi:hypothetical protein
MRRREFISLLGGAAATWPLAARAQQPGRVRRIGVLVNLSEDDSAGQRFVAAFRQALQELGWVGGSNARIDMRWDAGDRERYRNAITYARTGWRMSPFLAFGGRRRCSLRILTAWACIRDATAAVDNLFCPPGQAAHCCCCSRSATRCRTSTN